MSFQQFIERYKTKRKQAFLNQPGSYRHQYAFIGTGQHSFDNLYPIVQYLALPLKRICARHAEHAVKMAARFPACTGSDHLEDILNDEQIRGVFVSASPSQHFELVQRLLTAGKNVLVEKPPCYTLHELQKLAVHDRAKHCLVGLQKRFSTINRRLERYTGAAIDYSCRYLTGRYPEGDPLVELFIHPIDNLVYLFGEPEQVQIQASKNNRTWFLQLRHKNNVTGALHISTDHRWKLTVDELLINTESAILEASYPNLLTATAKPKAYFNIPFEKISKMPVVKKVLVDNNNFVPTAAYNSVAMQGFLGEIEAFIKMTEKDEYDSRQHLQRLTPVYGLIETIKKA
jgi:virulence factor